MSWPLAGQRCRHQPHRHGGRRPAADKQAARDAFSRLRTEQKAESPAQVQLVNEVFSPTPDALNWARGVVRSFEEADGGIRVVDGSMVGPPFLRKALAILERSEGR